jgi:hypothetical protein
LPHDKRRQQMRSNPEAPRDSVNPSNGASPARPRVHSRSTDPPPERTRRETQRRRYGRPWTMKATSARDHSLSQLSRLIFARRAVQEGRADTKYADANAWHRADRRGGDEESRRCVPGRDSAKSAKR